MLMLGELEKNVEEEYGLFDVRLKPSWGGKTVPYILKANSAKLKDDGTYVNHEEDLLP